MGSIWVWTRCQWRRRRGGAFAATLLFALAVGVVLTASAGARRTQTAYPRMVEAVGASDVLANPDAGADTNLDFDAVEALPGVQALGRAAGVFVVPPLPDGSPDFSAPLLTLASADGNYGYTVDRFLLSEGRVPNPNRADEILVDPRLAETLGLRAGDSTTLLVPDLTKPPGSNGMPSFLPREFRVTGIGLGASQILTDENFDYRAVLLTPAFYEEQKDAVGFWGLGVRLDDPSPEGILAFRRSVDRLAAGEDIEYRSQQVDTDAVRRAVQPQVLALYLFGALAGLAALVIIGQSLARPLALDEREALTLQALGVRRRTLFAGGMARALVLGAVGAGLGVALSVGASSRFPIGFVRRAEPHPGIDVNVAYLAGGAAIAVLLLMAVVAVPVWRGSGLATSDARPTRPSVAAGVLSRWGGGPAVVSGVRFALEPAPGRSGAGVRSSLLGGVLVAAILSTAVTFGASLAHVVDTPRLYGWAWDVRMTADVPIPELEAALDADDRVVAWSRITNNRLVIEGAPVPSVGVSSAADAVVPTIVDGHAPRSGDEIALGANTMRRLHTALGRDVTVTTPEGDDHHLRVVGRAVFPGLGTYSGSERTELGTGAMVTIGALRRLGPDITNGNVMVRLVPGTDSHAFADDMTAVFRLVGASDDQIDIATRPERPTDIIALRRVRSTPLLLALLLAALILVQIVITLVTSNRRRRHDLALLKTIGFLRRQVAAAVAWQTATFALIALAIGVPLGIAAGRALWTALADHLGAVAEPITPLTTLALLTAATLVVGTCLAYAGGVLLARARPAAALRSE